MDLIFLFYYLCIAFGILFISRWAMILFISSFSSLLFIGGSILENTSIIVNFLFIFIVVRYYANTLKKRIKNYEISEIRKKQGEILIYGLVCLVFLFIMPILIKFPWFLDIETRVLYLENVEFLKRLIIILSVVLSGLFIVYEHKNNGLTKIFIFYLLFALFYGAKSGIIFFIMHYIILIDSGKIVFDRKVLFKVVILSMIILVIMLIFMKLLVLGNYGIFDVLKERFISDFTGIERALDISNRNFCQKVSIFDPVSILLNKLINVNPDITVFTSLGKCLASPNDPSYPFELLVPFYLEINFLYGSLFATILFFFFVTMHYILIGLLIYITKIIKFTLFAFSLEIYRFYSIVGILFGGKFFNWFTSEYLSLVTLIFLLFMVYILIPRKAILKGNIQ